MFMAPAHFLRMWYSSVFMSHEVVLVRVYGSGPFSPYGTRPCIDDGRQPPIMQTQISTNIHKYPQKTQKQHVDRLSHFDPSLHRVAGRVARLLGSVDRDFPNVRQMDRRVTIETHPCEIQDVFDQSRIQVLVSSFSS